MNRSAREERLQQVLQEAQIDADYLDRYPHEFSGGQAQRIAIARALIVNPKVLIMDEPVSALDVSIQAEILELLKNLHQQKGISFLIITHDLAVVNQICPRILVMKDGRIVEDGPRQSILNSPKQDYTKELLSSILSFKSSSGYQPL
jgi:ABC-type oligopeptide transport system ATPase subunit